MYTLALSSGELPPALQADMCRWLREELAVPSIERSGARWFLFHDPAMQEAAQRRVMQDPSEQLHAYAFIWIRSLHVEMETARDPITDQALHAFTCWAQERAPLQLADSGVPIPASDLIHPELYE